VSQYQKQHSPAHTHEEEEEGFAQTTRTTLSQRGLLHPIKPAYNQSWLDGQLILTASAFDLLWIRMLAILVTLPTITQNLLHSLSTSSVSAHHLVDFAVQGKITEADAQTIPFLQQMPFLPQPSQFILA